MKITNVLLLLAVISGSRTAWAVDCSAQFSACLTSEANNHTANGTDLCLQQRTACVAALQIQPVAPFDPFAVAVTTPSPAQERKEHREQERALRREQAEERQDLRQQQRNERDAKNWQEFGHILARQIHERIDLRHEQREERKTLRSDQKLDGNWSFWSAAQ